MATNVIKTYRDLLVWDKAVDLAVSVCLFCDEHRKPACYTLMDQLVRAS